MSLPHLHLSGCNFEERIILDDAHIRCLDLTGSSFPGLSAEHLKCLGTLRMSGGMSSDAISIGRGHIHGDVLLDNGFRVNGQVDLSGCQIEGEFIASGSNFSHSGHYTLIMDLCRIECGVALSEGFEASGMVRLNRAHVRGQLTARGGRFSNGTDTALNLDGISVDGTVFLDREFMADGQVRLNGADITGQLVVREAHIQNPKGVALSMDEVRIGAGAFIDAGTRIEGETRVTDGHMGLPRVWLSPNLTSIYSQEGCAPCPKPFPPSSTRRRRRGP